MNRHIHIVTDGSAIGNPGPGGWGAVFTSGKKCWQISGSSEHTTINEMELTAAIEALKILNDGSCVTLCSDSKYLVRGMQHLADRWAEQGWRNRKGLLIRDRDLWQTLLLLRGCHHIRWQWVRGHNGHRAQAEADRLAYTEARRRWSALRNAA